MPQSSQSWTSRSQCAFCASPHLALVEDFGQVALAGGFLKPEEFAEEERFPMRLYFCEDCFAVQLVDVVDPAVLFKRYFYFSSAIRTLREHFVDYATEVVSRFLVPEQATVVEIGCNDGILLKPIADQGVRTVIGVDPATNVVAQIDDPRIRIVNDFFSATTSRQILEEYGAADLIVANNVFAHIADIAGVAGAVKALLKDNGVFVFEVHYLGKIILGMQYDMVYHEHLYYYSLLALENFFARLGMVIFDVKSIQIHAGSMRYYVCKEGSDHARAVSCRVGNLREEERRQGFDRHETFVRFASDIYSRKLALLALLTRLRSEGKRVVGYGASGRANTIIQYCGITHEHMEYMVDDAGAKHGFFTPGSHFEIRPSSSLQDDPPDYLLLFAWGYYSEIAEKHRSFFGAGGRMILPLPDVRVIYQPEVGTPAA
ncbi:class I SAM-dependent methyltransferase [uncultured Thiodictyon sp.]|jgi:SAM-dependent methyltransferase|uniref:class I SAM-dependent methyltransferase n=1 Tax=uncultured Thiodictyon sp. TaxID=1846217 RepID=UPI0025D0D337|nr:class I SAM-dependent methyltransferase [uncultured Thiodictyon sp.]